MGNATVTASGEIGLREPPLGGANPIFARKFMQTNRNVYLAGKEQVISDGCSMRRTYSLVGPRGDDVVGQFNSAVNGFVAAKALKYHIMSDVHVEFRILTPEETK